jgi:FKBP-type peptidyl-prolyl cis-trans isomerase
MVPARSPFRTTLALLAACAAVFLGACGDDDGGSATTDTAATETQATQPPAPAEPEAPKAKKVQPTAGEADIDTKPKVPKGKRDPPTELVVQDLIVGKGKRAQSGATVSVRYVGVLFENGKEFDASWQDEGGKGQTFQFALGGGQVIPGWDQGVVGMREGGRRKLIIPSDLAYGAQGFPPDIPPDAALIFDIDLVRAGS